MKVSRLKGTIELVAVFSIVASLVFVGMQLMLDRGIAVTESVAKASDGRKYMAELIADHRETWIHGLADELQNDSDQAAFNAIAEAQRMDFYGSWFRARTLKHVNAERFAISYALYLIQYPGLLKHFEENQVREIEIRKFSGGAPGTFGQAIEKVLSQLQERNDTT